MLREHRHLDRLGERGGGGTAAAATTTSTTLTQIAPGRRLHQPSERSANRPTLGPARAQVQDYAAVAIAAAAGSCAAGSAIGICLPWYLALAALACAFGACCTCARLVQQKYSAQLRALVGLDLYDVDEQDLEVVRGGGGGVKQKPQARRQKERGRPKPPPRARALPPQ